MFKYDSPNSDEESANDETACDVGEIPSLQRRRIFSSEEFLASTAEFCSVNFSLFSLLWNYGLPSPLFFFYTFVDIAVRFFDTDLSLLIRFSMIEVRQKEVVTATSVSYSCKTSKTSKMNNNIVLVKRNQRLTVSKDFNWSILVEKRPL